MRRLACLLAALVAALAVPGTASAIDGGDAADPAAGYLARIDVVRTATSTWTCSGALVGPRLVVTALHCLYSARPSDWTVTVAHGAPGAETRGVVAAVPYPGSPPSEDLAVLVLDRTVAQAPVALATTAAAAGAPVVATGYGATRPGGNMSPVARRGGQVVDRLASRAGSPSLLLTRAAGPSAGACDLGDSGGPLVPAGAPALLGVLSEANGAAGLCWYTRVDRGGPARAWLDRMIEGYGGAAAAPTAPLAPAAPTPAAPTPTAAPDLAGAVLPGSAVLAPVTTPATPEPVLPVATTPESLGPLAGTAAADVASGPSVAPAVPAPAVPVFTADAFAR